MNTTRDLATTSAPAAIDPRRFVGTWSLDPIRSRVTLRTRSVWGLVRIRGTFDHLAGSGVVSADGRISGLLIVNAGSINTGNRKRDRHLRSEDFLDVDEHPEIIFRLDDVLLSDSMTLDGMLEVKSRRVPFRVPVQVQSPDPDTVLLDTEVMVDRGAFGITASPLGMASTKNVVAVKAVFTRA